MRIDRIDCVRGADRVRFSARLVWEDRERADDVLWYEWPSSFADEIAPAGAAALVAALPLALINHERRVHIDAPVCAYLHDHLRDAMQLFGVWYPELTSPAIEARKDIAQAASEPRRAAICLSGGADSLAALIDNHASLAPGHRERVQDGIYVFGLNTYDFADGVPVRPREEWYEEYGRLLAGFCAKTDIALIPVATNVRSLYADFSSWERVGPAASLAAIAHAMPRHLHALTIATAGIGVYPGAFGTVPLLDPLYSSYSLNVRSVHATVVRLEKTRIIASHDEALAVLRVCLYRNLPPAGALNCGKCEKCLRTILALEACGALHRATSFPVRELRADMLADLDIGLAVRVDSYRALIGPLRERGRDDLARAVERRIAHFERRRSFSPKSLMHRLLRG